MADRELTAAEHDLRKPTHCAVCLAGHGNAVGRPEEISTWRRLWVALAEAEAELGIAITPSQLDELRAKIDEIDFAAAAKYEASLRHDVMAHVHTYGDACPQARPIIHLGATSNFVVDNTDLLLIREGLQLVRNRLVAVILALADFAQRHRDLPTLGFTHLQPAQPTTVGKRATLWLYDLVLDLDEVEHRLVQLRARSTKGTTEHRQFPAALWGRSR